MVSTYGTTVEHLGPEAADNDVARFDALVDLVTHLCPEWTTEQAIEFVWNNGAWDTGEPLRIENESEAEAMTFKVLHCGTVRVGDDWDEPESWLDPNIRAIARQVLIEYRRDGSLPDDETRQKLAVCCA